MLRGNCLWRLLPECSSSPNLLSPDLPVDACPISRKEWNIPQFVWALRWGTLVNSCPSTPKIRLFPHQTHRCSHERSRRSEANLRKFSQERAFFSRRTTVLCRIPGKWWNDGRRTSNDLRPPLRERVANAPSGWHVTPWADLRIEEIPRPCAAPARSPPA